MEIRLSSPRNPFQVILAIVVFAVLVAIGFVMMGFVIVLVAVALIVAPIVRWWNLRKGAAPTAEMHVESPSPRPTRISDDDGPIVDAEFEVKDD